MKPVFLEAQGARPPSHHSLGARLWQVTEEDFTYLRFRVFGFCVIDHCRYSLCGDPRRDQGADPLCLQAVHSR